MAAAARRAVQHQGAQVQQALQLAAAIRPCPSPGPPVDLIPTDVRLRLPVALSAVPHDWQFLQDRRPCVIYSFGLTPLKAWNYAAVRGYYMRNISQLVAPANGKRAFLVDTLALVILFLTMLLQFLVDIIQLNRFLRIFSTLLSSGNNVSAGYSISTIICKVVLR